MNLCKPELELESKAEVTFGHSGFIIVVVENSLPKIFAEANKALLGSDLRFVRFVGCSRLFKCDRGANCSWLCEILLFNSEHSPRKREPILH